LLLAALNLRIDGKDRLDRWSNQAVSAWMRLHLAVTTVPLDDRAALIEVEEVVLQRLDPPLNLLGMPSTAIRLRLGDLCRNLTAGRTEVQMESSAG
jgi:hypothetical protein